MSLIINAFEITAREYTVLLCNIAEAAVYADCGKISAVILNPANNFASGSYSLTI